MAKKPLKKYTIKGQKPKNFSVKSIACFSTRNSFPPSSTSLSNLFTAMFKLLL